MAVLYIGNYEGLGLLALNLHPQTIAIYIYFVTAGQYWYGTSKHKNVFRSTLNLCT